MATIETYNLSQRAIEEISKKISGVVLADIELAQKEVLTSEETARYMGVSMSYLYKLTMRREIPHYKPMGKICYFNRREVEAWIQRNKVEVATEI